MLGSAGRGGLAAGAGNVISGNSDNGIFLDASSALVAGNLIGTDATGTQPVPNQGDGIYLDLGDATQETLRAIWSGPAYRSFRRALLSDTPPEACASCGLRWSL